VITELLSVQDVQPLIMNEHSWQVPEEESRKTGGIVALLHTHAPEDRTSPELQLVHTEKLEQLRQELEQAWQVKVVEFQ
jgi:hypothetical protein